MSPNPRLPKRFYVQHGRTHLTHTKLYTTQSGAERAAKRLGPLWRVYRIWP